MSNKDLHINTIKTYLNSKTTAAEKDAIKQNNLLDDFEKEALEGFESLEDNALALQRIKKLEQEIAEKTNLETKREFTIPFAKIGAIAATVLSVFGIGYLVSLGLKNDKNEMAKLETEGVDENQEFAPVLNDTSTQNNAFFSDSLNQILPQTISVEERNNQTAKNENDDAKKLAKETSTANKDLNTFETADDEAEDLVKPNTPLKAPVPAQETVSTLGKTSGDKASADSYFNNTGTITATETIQSNIASSNNYANGKAAYDSKNYTDAINFFEQSVSDANNINESNYYIGLSYYNTNKASKALKSFDKVINTNEPLRNNALWYKSVILLDKGNTQDAKQILEELANGNSGFKNQAKDKLDALK
ncbi:MAG: tetratricopeptide repeat protein [Chitinophagales bacterium]|nr:tetratricopeptide repeat protein [Chitinophagales bacterium]